MSNRLWSLALVCGVLASTSTWASSRDDPELDKLTAEVAALEEVLLDGAQGEGIDIPTAGSPVLGPQSAPVAVVVYGDFQCPFCARAHPKLVDAVHHPSLKGKIKLVFKHFPLSFHKQARAAAHAALAAQEQGKFWEMAEKLYQDPRNLTSENFSTWAKQIGLDVKRFERDLVRKKAGFDDVIDNDMRFGQKTMKVRGTPTIFVGGHMLRGARDADNIAAFIDARGLLRGKEKAHSTSQRLKELTVRLAAVTKEAKRLKSRVNRKPKQRNPPPQQEKAYDIPVAGSPVMGNPRAPVSVVIFTDLQCPYCSKVDPMLYELLKDDELKKKVKVVFKHFPLGFHKDAKPASKAALAAGEQGKFFEFVALAYDNQRQLKPENFIKWAKQLGLDVEKFKRDLKQNDAAYERRIQQDQKLGASVAKVRGTPSLYVGGWQLRNRSVEGVRQLIADKNL
mgnify:CR=1 FL=1